MDISEKRPADQRPWRQPRWAMIAFYVGLVLLIAFFKYSFLDDEVPQNQRPSSLPPITERERSGDERDRANDDRQPKSRGSYQAPPAVKQDRSPANADGEQAGDRKSDLIVHYVSVFDEDHHVIYHEDVDLGPTIDRIQRGVRLRFSHDGIVFENREKRLPAKPSGYYHEFVQPTPGESGPGPQRLVFGREGEIYYSSDHYRTLRRIR